MLTIENNVLVKCDENATEVVIPADITEIESDAFEGCKALKTLRFPKDFDFGWLLSEFDPREMRDEPSTYYGAIDAFFFDSLTDVYYEGTIVEWIEASGFLFFKENVKIHCIDGDAAPLTPDMEKIVIPKGVTEIPDNAFLGYDCAEIEIPDSVTSIGDFALCNTSNLKSITLPAGLNDIGENAFQDSGLWDIYFKGTKEQWKKVSLEQPWGTSDDEWLLDIDIVHCSDGDVPFDDIISIDETGYLKCTNYAAYDYSIPVEVKRIASKAFSTTDIRSFDLHYEGTLGQWCTIEKEEKWDDDDHVVHCSDGDFEYPTNYTLIAKGSIKPINENAMKSLTQFANLGYAEAQCQLGLYYYYGASISQDYSKAVELWTKASDQGFEDAEYYLAHCYHDGTGVNQDYYKAAQIWIKLIKNGNKDSRFIFNKTSGEIEITTKGNMYARYNLGRCYHNGEGVPKSFENAIYCWTDGSENETYYLKLAAENGYSEAQWRLGQIYKRDYKKQYQEAAELFRKSAEQGNIKAQTELGICYRDGQGVEKNYEKAIECFNCAEKQGYSEAQNCLGLCYMKGYGVEQDSEKAIEWFKKAVEQGNANAQYNLGFCLKDTYDYNAIFKLWRDAAKQENPSAVNILGYCYDGIEIAEDKAEAFSWWKKAAEEGYAEAQFVIGRFYSDGIGVNKDEKEAFAWWKKAADQDYDFAQICVGRCYYYGTGTTKDDEKSMFYYGKIKSNTQSYIWLFKDSQEDNTAALICLGNLKYNSDEKKYTAVRYYKKAAELGNSVAMYKLGECYYNGKGGVDQDYKEAVEWYKKAIEQGNVLAQNALGECYTEGRGVEQDYEKAVEMFKKAAEQGAAVAQLNLGKRYIKGQGVEKDFEKAFEWCKKSAEQGYADAQWGIGFCYYEGWHIEQDFTKAIKWLQKAAEQGHRSAIYELGICYAEGKGVEQDYAKAVEWYKKSAQQGYSDAIVRLKRLTDEFNKQLYEAIKNNNIEEVLNCINCGAELNKSLDIPSEYTPLMVAAQYDFKEIAELLIERGAKVNSPIVLENGSYYYPLSAAAEWNAKKVAETLLKHGAEIDTDDVYDDGNPGLLPIDYAIQNNSKDIVELFLDHGYKIYNLNIWEKEIDEDSDEEGWELVGTDPIAYAEEHNFTELAELLKKHLKKS